MLIFQNGAYDCTVVFNDDGSIDVWIETRGGEWHTEMRIKAEDVKTLSANLVRHVDRRCP
jgi:hypothetical protein